MNVSGPNDQQTKSLSGQMVILVGHCLLTGRYDEQMKKKKRNKVFLPSSIFSSLACLGSLRAAVQSFCVPSYRLIKRVGLELLVADVLQNSSTFFIHLGEEIKAFFTKGYFFLDPQPAKRKKEMSL